jgi:hypothetical protein
MKTFTKWAVLLALGLMPFAAGAQTLPQNAISIPNAEEKATSDAPVDKKIPESVRAITKKLSSAASNEATLEDLNSAREAIAKLDVLIDLEKRISDLAQLRQDREKASISPLSAAALMPKNVQSPLPVRPIEPIEPVRHIEPVKAMVSSPDKVYVDRIFGTEGNYTAKIRIGANAPQTVREGDKVSDGGIVRAILPSGVRIVHGTQDRTYSVTSAGSFSSAAK